MEGRGVKFQTTNYRELDGHRKGVLFHRGFWVSRVPRVMLVCRLFGHKPVVDGAGDRYRWVACDRCGVRTTPQGPVDSDVVMGQPFTDELPGPWPKKPSGTLGGELVLGRTHGVGSVEFKVGNAGSEQVLAAHIGINPLGSLHLYSERHGQWLQRRLNSVGYNSRVTGVSIHDGRLHWTLWAKRDEWSSDDPKWQQGSLRVDPRDILLGERLYSYEDVGEELTATVRMPHGDDHEVILQLQRQTHGRKRGAQRQSWAVDWNSRNGIPVRWDDGWKGDSIYGSAVSVSDQSVEAGSWPFAAVAAIAKQLMADRVRYGWQPEVEAEA